MITSAGAARVGNLLPGLLGQKLLWQLLSWLLLLASLVSALTASAATSLCAQVSIQIEQQLTLERQAFDAHMRINNGLDTFDLENVSIDVLFTDEDGNPVLATSDPDNTSALFFIRVDSLSGIDNIDGTGTVAPNTSADIHWLIVPAPGAGGQTASGELYYVGATLRYTLGGEENVTEVTPDFIFVKPMPLLTLDYFLTRDVYADDAFTPEIEPPEPFTLGVRVTNNGYGVAYDLRIDSAQPQIIDNELGLLIDFQILGSSVDEIPATPSLLVEFGDVDPNASTVARWTMQTTLSGQFVEFSADFTHADELGGELTSLLEATTTHFLVHDVRVDLPGRDSVRDFLAKDDDVLRVYESHGLDSDVTDQSGNATLVPAGQNGSQVDYSLTVPPTTGFLYVQLPDPQGGAKEITRVMRSDGKLFAQDNAWLSRTRRQDNGWDHFINLFDSDGTGRYLISMDAGSVEPHPPVLQFIPDRTTYEGNQVSFVVEASDPDGTLPVITATPLPAGATFIEDTQGSLMVSTYVFDWTPAIGQAGDYDIEYTASDGDFEVSQIARITVCPFDDPDCLGGTGAVSLHAGFNLFSYPGAVPAEHATCQGLLADLAMPDAIEGIDRLNTQTGLFEHCDYDSGGDFLIEAGEGYVVRMTQDATLDLSATSVCPSPLLTAGPNLIGHPAPVADLTCYDLLSAYGEVAVSTIQRFNAETGAFESCTFFDSGDGDGPQPAGQDFPIVAGEGLIVHAKIDVQMQLPGCQN